LDGLKICQLVIILLVQSADAILVYTALGGLVIVHQRTHDIGLVKYLHVLQTVLLLSPIVLVVLRANEMLIRAIIVVDIALLVGQILLAQQPGTVLQVLLLWLVRVALVPV
jgi:hypothetical protein